MNGVRRLPWGDEELVRSIEAYWAEHGYAPSVRDVWESLPLSAHDDDRGPRPPSISTVHMRLTDLRRKGRVTWIDNRARTLRAIG